MFAMALLMEIGQFDSGGHMTLVAKVKTDDPGHDQHLLRVENVGTLFVFRELLDGQSDSVTVVDAVVVTQFPNPVLEQGPFVQILYHATCMWNDYYTLVDVCSGLGGIARGALSVGVQTEVDNDCNETMLDLHQVHSGAVVALCQLTKPGCWPVESANDDIFSASMRVLMFLTIRVLNSSGCAGACVEPCSAAGLSVQQDYMVIRPSKFPLRELMHLKQTYPAVVGLARNGVRRGLRFASTHAQEIHAMVRSDTPFLLKGDRVQYIVGSFMDGQFQEFSHHHAWQVSAHCQQLHGQMECQNQSPPAIFETQISHSRGLLSNRPCYEGERWCGREPSLPSCFPVFWFCSGVWWVLVPVYMVLGFASLLRQDRHGFMMMVQLIAVVLAFSGCRIGVDSHPGPDAGVSSFVLGVPNPTGLRCNATHVSEHFAHGDSWALSCLALPWCAQRIEATVRWMTQFSEPFRRLTFAFDSLPVTVARCHH